MLDPATAQSIGDPVDILMVDENGTRIGPAKGIAGTVQDPITGDLLGINNGFDERSRELLKIDPITGTAEVIGMLETSEEPGFNSLIFVGYQIHDMDQNHTTDIAAFVLGLNNPSNPDGGDGYLETYGVPATLSGDNTGNGIFDFDDIAGFIASLRGSNGTAPVPEPASIVLLGLGLMSLMGPRRRRR